MHERPYERCGTVFIVEGGTPLDGLPGELEGGVKQVQCAAAQITGQQGGEETSG